MEKILVVLPSLKVKYCETTFVAFSAQFSAYLTSGMDLTVLLGSRFLLPQHYTSVNLQFHVGTWEKQHSHIPPRII